MVTSVGCSKFRTWFFQVMTQIRCNWFETFAAQPLSFGDREFHW